MVSQPVQGNVEHIDGNMAEATSNPSEVENSVGSKENQSLHYKKRNLIWSYEEYEWMPYDPSEYTPPPPRCDLENYFYVDARYKERNPQEPSEIILTEFSPMLINFLRAYIGNEFFGSDPEYGLQRFFRILKDLHSRFNLLKDILGAPDECANERRKLARKLGAKDIDYGHLGDEHIKQYLSDILEHAVVLLHFLDAEFQPIADRLAMLLSYEQIEYDLLLYYFEKGRKILAGNVALTVQSTRYTGGPDPAFYIKGEGVYWDGIDYSSYTDSESIAMFKGTAQLEDLSCVLLTPEMEAKLKERGRLYTSYSGMHYRAYDDRRVIVDRVAYDNRGGYIADPDKEIPELAEEQLYLLPTSVYGFDLTLKQWRSFLVEKLSPVVHDEGAWDHLVLDPDTKTLIKGLVDVTKNVNSTKQIIADVISGKGGGLIAVLHGPPGTGKTLTAEAVAEYLKRPLYMVGSSELPAAPSQLEESLRSILKLATAWDAVLLIDEADVYLERRSLHELSRNALVSVALRVLEYHRGVLFLTTNRIKNFDDAFLSRFSIGIKYPELDQSARRRVWQKFFELAKIPIEHAEGSDSPGSMSGSDASTGFVEVSADKVKDARRELTTQDLDDLSLKPFNGRTIKNLVRTAQALALASNEPLSIEHVNTVVRASEKFLDEFAHAENEA